MKEAIELIKEYPIMFIRMFLAFACVFALGLTAGLVLGGNGEQNSLYGACLFSFGLSCYVINTFLLPKE